jgi:ATP-binding cassette subfamily F protein 3
MLTLSELHKSYGPRTLFDGITLHLQRRQRMGFVGPNGAGKSTLFRILLGEEEADSGEVSWERGVRLGYLPQEIMQTGEASILDIAIGHVDAAEDDHHHEVDYTLEPRAKKILAGLGFQEGDHAAPARTFSGGWIMRAHLARLLVDAPDLLLLDEPTNHLDLSALLWFQDYLKNYPGGIIVISHDRAFLNAICSSMLELRQRQLYRWTGNYDSFLEQKAAHEVQQAALHKNQKREIAHLQKFVDRFGAKATMASRAKSKEKAIARMEADAIDAPTGDGPKIGRFNFPQPDRTGHKVIELKAIKQAYDDKVVYQNLNYEIERGEKQVLIGPNGAGKSTLLKILADRLPLLAGERTPGLRVKVGYFSQNRSENLDPRHTVLDEALSARADNPGITEQMTRDLLGAFLFRGDDSMGKSVSVLSGGEKSRLALVKLLLAPPSLLLMDEPTTHLDIPSIDALIGALKTYQGTLVFISHDVHFIKAVAKKVVHVEAGRLTPYAGDYDYYMHKTKANDARSALVSSQQNAGYAPPKPTSREPRQNPKERRRLAAKARDAQSKIKREVTALEAEVTRLETRPVELSEKLSDSTTYNDAALFRKLQTESDGIATALEKATKTWEQKAGQVKE